MVVLWQALFISAVHTGVDEREVDIGTKIMITKHLRINVFKFPTTILPSGKGQAIQGELT